MTTTESRDAAALVPARHRQDDDTDLLPAVDVAIAVADHPTGSPDTPRRTVLPRVVETPAVRGPARRRSGGSPPGDATNLAMSVLGALALGFLLFGVLGPLTGTLGFVVVVWAAFLVIYAALTSLDNTGSMVRDRIMTVALGTAAFVLFATLAVVVFFVLGRGLSAMVHLNFFTKDQSVTGPLDPLTMGGVLHAIIGTLIMMAICLAITVPLGIACAVFLAVVKGPGSRFVRTIVEAMTALPSIVAGLFVLATWILILGFERSGLAASFALSVMMLPIIIRSADVVLRLVPGTLMEASEALGAPRWRTVWHVVLPTSKSGLATAVILGTARGVGETSPVLLTAGYTQNFNFDPLHGPMVSLPLAAFTFTRSPQPEVIARGFGAAATLMILVLILFIVARLIGGRGAGRLSPRQQRRVLRQSGADAARFAARSTNDTAGGAGSAGAAPAGSPVPGLQIMTSTQTGNS